MQPAPRQTHPARLALARLALVAGTFALLFAVGEAAVRLHLIWAFLSNPPPEADPSLEALPVLKTPMELATPNVEGRYKGHAFRSNAYGFRGPDHAPVAEPGRLRIVVTGDSVVMGDGVDEDETYSRVLERLLSPERPTEVINLGLSGANVQSALDRLERGIEAYSPRVAIYGFTINDIEGPAYREASPEVKAAWKATRRGPFASSPSALLRVLSARIAALRAPRSPRENWYAQEVLDNYLENEAAWQGLLDGLDRYAKIIDEHGLCGHILIHTHLTALGEDHPFSEIYARVADAARARGLTVTESWPAFAGRDDQALWASVFDPHPGPEGHEILAGVLAQGLEARSDDCLSPDR